MTISGDQHVAGESFVASDLYAPVIKAHEARLLLAIAAAEDCLVYKTDTSQASLYERIENDEVYIRVPASWPEPIPEGESMPTRSQVAKTKFSRNCCILSRKMPKVFRT